MGIRKKRGSCWPSPTVLGQVLSVKEFEAFLNQALPTLYLLNSTLVTDLLLQLSAAVCTVSIHHHLTSPLGDGAV